MKLSDLSHGPDWVVWAGAGLMLALSLVLFAAVYELILYRFSKKLNALPLRAVMI